MAPSTRVTDVPHLHRFSVGIGEKVHEIFRGWYYVVYKYLAGYLIVAISFVAIVGIHRVAPLWPVTPYTLMVLVALAFPGTAFLYFTFNLRTRLDEIQDAAKRGQLHRVYYNQFESSQAERKFYGLLLRRFGEYYNPLELSGFSLFAGALAFTMQFLLAQQAGIMPDAANPPGVKLPDLSHTAGWVILLVLGFGGALSGSLLTLAKKYRTFDIYASTYLYAAVALLVGTVAGAALSAVVPSAVAPEVFVFALAFFTATHVSFLGEFLRTWLADKAGVKLPPPISTDLDRVVRNTDGIESLGALSLNSVSELVAAEPLALYLNLPQPLGVINGWLDRGLLFFYLDVTTDALHQAHIEFFTQLVELLIDKMSPDQIVWKEKPIITGNPETDEQIQRTVSNIVQARLHHRLLGILWEKYRATFFTNGADGPAHESEDENSEVPHQQAA